MHRVLIVEDHAETREWLVALVQEAFPNATTTTAGTLEQARWHLERHQVGLALVDISLPDGSGLDLIAELAEHAPDTYPVVATIYDDDRHLFAALRAGAKGYLLKDQPRGRLIENLQGIVHGSPPLSPGVARRILRYFNNSPEPAQRSATANLSARETEVLRLLARGFNRADIANALNITANTAAGYIKTIYRKLNVSGRAEAALEAVNLGLIEPDTGR